MTATTPKTTPLEMEQNELRHMINQGLTFEIDVTETRRRPGIAGFFGKRQKVTEKRTYTIKEPTLATLDRLSALWLQMEIDESRIGDADYLITARKMANQQARRLSEVVAIAVLGEDYFDLHQRGGRMAYRPNDTRMRQLAETFFHAVKPSDLFTLAVMITHVSNLGDFISSIRLMSATRTSEPINNPIDRQA